MRNVNLLPELARTLPPERVSDNIICILDRVIHARSECAAHYKQKVGLEPSNARHEYFLSILKEV